MQDVSHFQDLKTSSDIITPVGVQVDNVDAVGLLGSTLQQVAALDLIKRKHERLNLVAYALYRTQSAADGISLRAAVSLVPGATLTYTGVIAAGTPSDRGRVARGELTIAQLPAARQVRHHRDCPRLAQCLALASLEIRAAVITTIGVHPDLVRARP